LIDNIPNTDRHRDSKKDWPFPICPKWKTLEKKADFIIVPCVTAHYYVERLQRRINIPILHIAEETVKYMEARLKGVRRVGLIATTGTVQAGIFQRFFPKISKELILPTSEVQEKRVMKAIYGKDGIKAIGPSKSSKRLILQACRTLIRPQSIIAGCTEIPLVLRMAIFVFGHRPAGDSAQSAVARAKKSRICFSRGRDTRF
jgi:aspartate racemase